MIAHSSLGGRLILTRNKEPDPKQTEPPDNQALIDAMDRLKTEILEAVDQRVDSKLSAMGKDLSALVTAAKPNNELVQLRDFYDQALRDVDRLKLELKTEQDKHAAAKANDNGDVLAGVGSEIKALRDRLGELTTLLSKQQAALLAHKEGALERGPITFDVIKDAAGHTQRIVARRD